MYKNLIIALALIFGISVGFYMIQAGGGELVRNAFGGVPEQVSLSSPTPQSIAGIYRCNIKTGCKDKHVIMLREDQTIELLSSSDPSNEDEIKNEEEEAQESKPVERSSIVFIDENTPLEALLATETTTESSSTTNSSSTQEESVTPSIPEEEIIPDNISSLSEIEEASRAVVEKGTWSFGGGNILIITLDKLGDTEYTSPQKLIIRHIGASTLSGITFNKERYKEMVKPVFVKVE